MTAPKGNQFWKARSKHGRDKIIADSESLWESACEYFEWVESNPLWEDKIVSANGEPVSKPMFKMRAMTIEGLCLFLGISKRTWQSWREGDDQDFLRVVEQVDDIIRTQKFSGAAAGLLNANIIARDLGLRDAVDSKTEHSGKVEMTSDRAYQLLAEAGIDPDSLK